MLYRKVYQISQTEFKERFLKRTIRPSCFAKIKAAWRDDVRKRVYFGKLENCKFDLYTCPDMMGPWFSAPWFFPWRGMAMWAAPVHVYGTIYGTKEQTMIDYYITKPGSTKCMAVFGLTMLSIPLIFIRSWIWNFGLDGIVILFAILCMLSLILASLYVPKSEKYFLMKFLDDLGEQDSITE